MSDDKKTVVETDEFADPAFGSSGFGFIKDGFKIRFSQSAVNAIFVFFSLLASVMTFFSSQSRDTGVESKSESAILPAEMSPGQQLSAPPIYDELKDRNEIIGVKRPNKGANSKTEGLSIISLTQLRAIPAGTEAKAILVSGASNGPVKAKLSESVRLDGDILIESGSILYGIGQSTEERLFISFNKLVEPNGREVKIKSQAYDESDKIVGLKGSKISNQATKFALSAGLSFLSGYVEAMKDPQPFLGITGGKRAPKDAALDGAATAAADQSKSVMESIKNAPVIIEVKQKSPIWVVFEEGDLK